ncbi:hypothetical protein KC19_VG284600 [Ceratodon purpureus]|uniref:Uncharacterized protein n=1 Tax=Ceratodon purpureus TaxID=3225 RepID=A0A8T0HVI2_CERPU|nr:hypothetical protein KC19_VG284600 [Ceratodon purpureus]
MGIFQQFLLLAYVIFPTGFGGHHSVSITCQSNCPSIFNLVSSLEDLLIVHRASYIWFCKVFLK